MYQVGALRKSHLLVSPPGTHRQVWDDRVAGPRHGSMQGRDRGGSGSLYITSFNGSPSIGIFDSENYVFFLKMVTLIAGGQICGRWDHPAAAG